MNARASNLLNQILALPMEPKVREATVAVQEAMVRDASWIELNSLSASARVAGSGQLPCAVADVAKGLSFAAGRWPQGDYAGSEWAQKADERFQMAEIRLASII